MKDLIIKEVAFNNVTMIGVQRQDGKVFVSVKKICDDLGINSSSQLTKIRSHSLLSKRVCDIALPSKGGIQQSICIEHKYLTSWLMTISPSKCKPDVQLLLEELQEKAADVLAEAFFGNPEPKQELTPLQALHAITGNMVLMESKVNKLETDIVELKDFRNKVISEQTIKQEKVNKLFEPERSLVLPLQKETRAKLRELINWYSAATDIEQQAVWRKLYKEFLLRYRIDVYQRAKSRNIKKLDYIESIAKMEELFAVASQILVIQKAG